MTRPLSITQDPLPLAQNFEDLKALGLKLVQELSGGRWSHLNDSDPGVTILEQLCYALIELGYCQDFPIEDILSEGSTNPSVQAGASYYENQFFRPRELLTSAPITVGDHEKWLLDQLPKLVDVKFASSHKQASMGENEVEKYTLGCFYLRFHDDAFPGSELQSAQLLLQQCRMLGQQAYRAELGDVASIGLGGDIYLQQHANSSQVANNIQQALGKLFQPNVYFQSYQELHAQHVDASDIFNGPALSRGWLHWNSGLPTSQTTASSLPRDPGNAIAQQSPLSPEMLMPIISQVPGVAGVENLVFDHFSREERALGQENAHFIKFEPARLKLHQLGAPVHAMRFSDAENEPLQQDTAWHMSAKSLGAHIQLQPPVIEGQPRQIEQYYSIQNTFPAIYGIGDNELPSSDGNTRAAQAQQLRGYLLVYDQLLANQFSQLAHLRQLFCFKEANTKVPGINPVSLVADYDANIPLQNFAPTYYCQSLYNIKNVEPLLQGFQEYQYQVGAAGQAQQHHKAWQKYKQDAFNPYVVGLRESMESDYQASLRRQQMLNHLLARHGEDSDLYDALVNTPLWYGSLLRTRNIIKAQVLQNYDKLSYNRSKGYCVATASKLHLPEQVVVQRINAGPVAPAKPWQQALLQLPLPKALACLLGQKPIPGYQDGRLDVELLDQEQQVTDKDFVNFSSFELSFNLISGIGHYYRQLCCLLLQLLRVPGFRHWLDDPIRLQQEGVAVYSVTLEDGSLLRFAREPHLWLIYSGGQELLRICPDGESKPSTSLLQHLLQLAWLATQRQGLLLLERAIYPDICSQLDAAHGATQINEYADIYSLVPSYVSRFHDKGFSSQFDQFSLYYCPAHISNQLLVVDFAHLGQLLGQYASQHNQLIWQSGGKQTGAPMQ